MFFSVVFDVCLMGRSVCVCIGIIGTSGKTINVVFGMIVTSFDFVHLIPRCYQFAKRSTYVLQLPTNLNLILLKSKIFVLTGQSSKLLSRF